MRTMVAGHAANGGRRLRQLAIAGLVVALAACETAGDPEEAVEAEVETAMVQAPELEGEALAAPELPADVAVLVPATAEQATPYEIDTLRLPAGIWDGYAQATGGSFLQCLIAKGPDEARLMFSIGWQRRLFLQFRAPRWTSSDLPAGTTATVMVDDLFETEVELGTAGDVLWASLGVDPTVANMIAEGDELTITRGTDSLVFPLTDSDLALPALYECLDMQTADEVEAAGQFSVYGLDLHPQRRMRLREAVGNLLLESGFDGLALADMDATVERYGRRAVASGIALGGTVELYAELFGVRSPAKKALIEVSLNAARSCKGEVGARLVRTEPGTIDDTSGRVSILCRGEDGDYVIETLGWLEGGGLLAIHGIARGVEGRDVIEAGFDRMTALLEDES